MVDNYLIFYFSLQYVILILSTIRSKKNLSNPTIKKKEYYIIFNCCHIFSLQVRRG